VDVQRLRLVNVAATVSSHVKNYALLDLPHCLVELLEICWQVELLHTAIVCDELEPKILGVEAASNEVLEQVPVHLYELARKHTAHIEVLRVGLEGLIVAKICAVLAVGIGATKSEFRRPC